MESDAQVRAQLGLPSLPTRRPLRRYPQYFVAMLSLGLLCGGVLLLVVADSAPPSGELAFVAGGFAMVGGAVVLTVVAGEHRRARLLPRGPQD